MPKRKSEDITGDAAGGGSAASSAASANKRQRKSLEEQRRLAREYAEEQKKKKTSTTATAAASTASAAPAYVPYKPPAAAASFSSSKTATKSSKKAATTAAAAATVPAPAPAAAPTNSNKSTATTAAKPQYAPYKAPAAATANTAAATPVRSTTRRPSLPKQCFQSPVPPSSSAGSNKKNETSAAATHIPLPPMPSNSSSKNHHTSKTNNSTTTGSAATNAASSSSKPATLPPLAPRPSSSSKNSNAAAANEVPPPPPRSSSRNKNGENNADGRNSDASNNNKAQPQPTPVVYDSENEGDPALLGGAQGVAAAAAQKQDATKGKDPKPPSSKTDGANAPSNKEEKQQDEEKVKEQGGGTGGGGGEGGGDDNDDLSSHSSDYDDYSDDDDVTTSDDDDDDDIYGDHLNYYAHDPRGVYDIIRDPAGALGGGGMGGIRMMRMQQMMHERMAAAGQAARLRAHRLRDEAIPSYVKFALWFLLWLVWATYDKKPYWTIWYPSFHSRTVGTRIDPILQFVSMEHVQTIPSKIAPSLFGNNMGGDADDDNGVGKGAKPVCYYDSDDLTDRERALYGNIVRNSIFNDSLPCALEKIDTRNDPNTRKKKRRGSNDDDDWKPCPFQGVCYGGQLLECEHPFEKGTTETDAFCLLSASSNETIRRLRDVLGNWTLRDYCRSAQIDMSTMTVTSTIPDAAKHHYPSKEGQASLLNYYYGQSVPLFNYTVLVEAMGDGDAYPSYIDLIHAANRIELYNKKMALLHEYDGSRKLSSSSNNNNMETNPEFVVAKFNIEEADAVTVIHPTTSAEEFEAIDDRHLLVGIVNVPMSLPWPCWIARTSGSFVSWIALFVLHVTWNLLALLWYVYAEFLSRRPKSTVFVTIVTGWCVRGWWKNAKHRRFTAQLERDMTVARNEAMKILQSSPNEEHRSLVVRDHIKYNSGIYNSEKDRQRFIEELWPRVTREVLRDERVRIIQYNDGTRWKWDGPMIQQQQQQQQQ